MDDSEFVGQFKTYKREFDMHVRAFRRHIEHEDKRWEQLLDATRANADAIHALAEQIKGPSEVYETGILGIRAMVFLGKIVIWLGSLGAVVKLYEHIR